MEHCRYPYTLGAFHPTCLTPSFGALRVNSSAILGAACWLSLGPQPTRVAAALLSPLAVAQIPPAVHSVCTAPGFLDTEQAGIVRVSVVASGSRRRETAILGNTQIAAPLVKSSL